MPREMHFPVIQPNQIQPPDTIVRGKCWVIDGDTIVIDKLHIRLAGIDAPELDHPFGQQSKWAMVALCKGQTVTARIKPELSYDRLVGECFLPDGRDLAAELVKVGLALDWPKFSGGKYRSLEPADARRKLWRANLRQGGMMPPGRAGQVLNPRVARALPARPATAPRYKAPWRINYRLGWLAVSGVLVLLVGCNLIGVDADPAMPRTSSVQTPAFAGHEVTAQVLNVRKSPASQSSVVAQLERGTIVVPRRVSGAWYGIDMTDGRTGWVHSDFLSPARR